MSKRKSPFSIKGWKDYLLQVSLILLSLFIAVGVDRCNQSLKDEDRRVAYLEAIEVDLLEEMQSNKLNLIDCEKDVKDIFTALRLLREDSPAARIQFGETMGNVFVRGVFRSFSPTTWDIIAQSGDALLIEDLELRSLLAANSVFRNDYVRADLLRHDAKTLEVAESLGPYLDLACLRSLVQDGQRDCITDFAGLKEVASVKLAIYLRQAESRAFHLDRAIKLNEITLKRLREIRGDSPAAVSEE
ncbi:hypothetical protein [Lewinella sp. W8]|uniref:hypothetical protein n=1 Tax=Lewinella sp. W8 TaxID=2528208 RepID=UPI00106872F5|nr:hypothetical protein [Lewinella sp. W8]MTB49775.1 hypothetical protein [Lewinella sp. W8]